MRTVYLIRHAMPDIPLGERWCVGGRTDFPLGPLGRLQAALLPFAPELRDVSAVFCSGLTRARETALPLCSAPRVIPGLGEQDMGAWDGLSFSEIRERYPELYAAREHDPSLLPEGAESESAVRARMEEALRRCLEESAGDVAAVSHKGAIASLLGGRGGLGYTSVTALRYEDGQLVSLERLGPPHPPMSDAVCLALLDASGADDKRKAHSLAVAARADELCVALRDKGLSLDAEAVHAAGLLHDLAKGEPDHPAVGALWLRELGYPELADIVRQHNDPDSTELNEAALVFLADKSVRGGKRVSLDERFSASLKKCTTPEAKQAHARRLAAAKALQNEINTLCNAELVS